MLRHETLCLILRLIKKYGVTISVDNTLEGHLVKLLERMEQTSIMLDTNMKHVYDPTTGKNPGIEDECND